MFGGEAALDGGFGVAFVAHLALDHADEVGAQDPGYGGYHAGDDIALGGCEGALEDLVDDVHYVVHGGGDVGGVGGDGLVHVEGEVGGLFVKLEGFFDRTTEVESCHLVERGYESFGDFAGERRAGEEGGHAKD